MNSSENSVAFGAPGIEPRWTSSAKEGFGTSYHTSCRVWFTISHGIINEIYYPGVDQPNTRDFQFLITDGETFCHEEKIHLQHKIEYPERACLLYRLTNSEPSGRYRLIKHVMTDPHRSVLLVHTKLEINDASLRGKLKLYALLAPHIERCGDGNSGRCTEIGESTLLHASRGHFHLVMGCTTHFTRRSVGYVGASDGWQDLTSNFKMDWEFRSAPNGNIALTGEIDPARGEEFVVAIGVGQSYPSASAKLLQSLLESFDLHRKAFVRQWNRAAVASDFDFSKSSTDGGGLYRLSRCVLLAHEDKVFEGAMVASMSIPWGEVKGDNELGGYHLVWTRDLAQSATALLATGQRGTPERALIWLAVIQRPDGSFPQNCWIDGRMYWPGLQLDEIAAPILLAWRLRREGARLGQYEPCPLVMKAAAYLILRGPVTSQERWEENAGYSPSTLAAVIAGLVCAEDFARTPEAREFLLTYADWLAAHIEEWTVTTAGTVVKGISRHYIRINTTDAANPDPHADPNATLISVANGGGEHPARDIVGGDFLQLVRFGIRGADDPIVRDSVEVIDRVIKRDLPQGPCWRRYNFDGYGQREDGGPFEGAGVGRAWPLLTGERGHYELAAGRDTKPYLTAMENFANDGGMLSEQLWDEPDLPGGKMQLGKPTGAAMPLCWAHAEYISLVRSCHDGVCFDRVEPAFQRYVAKPVPSRHEIWSFRHPVLRIGTRKTLRLILDKPANVVWTSNGWANTNKNDTAAVTELSLHYLDLPAEKLEAGAAIEFTFYWKNESRWEGRNFFVRIVS
jgi:glucoamylase